MQLSAFSPIPWGTLQSYYDFDSGCACACVRVRPMAHIVLQYHCNPLLAGLWENHVLAERTGGWQNVICDQTLSLSLRESKLQSVLGHESILVYLTWACGKVLFGKWPQALPCWVSKAEGKATAMTQSRYPAQTAMVHLHKWPKGGGTPTQRMANHSVAYIRIPHDEAANVQVVQVNVDDMYMVPGLSLLGGGHYSPPPPPPWGQSRATSNS